MTTPELFFYARVFALSLGLAACMAASAVRAQGSRSYAVLSLAGDELNIIHHAYGTGSNIDRNERQQLAMADDTFDRAVLQAVRNALGSGGDVALFTSRDPRLYALQDRALDTEELPSELKSAVGELIAKSSATHLILVTKHASPVNLRIRSGTVGDGKLAGLGYYLDRNLRTHNIDNGDTSTGFIAPFASLDITLIETRTLRTVRHVHAVESKVYPAAVSASAVVPWNILTPSQKVDDLVKVIDGAVREAVPKVIASD